MSRSVLTHGPRQAHVWLIFDVSQVVIATYYIYVDGADLRDVAQELLSRIEVFVAPYRGRVRVVNRREENDAASEFPAWDLGVNFEFDSLTDAEKKDLLLFFQSLSGELGRDFVIGASLSNGMSDDFITVSATQPLEPAIAVLTANDLRG